MCPHLLVPELAEALQRTAARRCVTLNLEAGGTETVGYRCEQMLEVLGDLAPELTLDAVVVDPSAVDDLERPAGGRGPVRRRPRTSARSVSTPARRVTHPLRLAAAYADVFAGRPSDTRRT